MVSGVKSRSVSCKAIALLLCYLSRPIVESFDSMFMDGVGGYRADQSQPEEGQI